MAKYRLHVDETVNILNYVDIETNLNERELDALLNKIEQDEITSTASLKRRLEAQGVKIKSIKLCSKPYYVEAKTLEIEELEEPQMECFLIKCKACDLNKTYIEQAIETAREKMNNSINKSGLQAAITVQLSQDLDELIVSHMRK
ncbi:aspartyl-phosphate phosphatase Spo0E family protein [Clostridium sp. HBUAS56017]|uniref:aspartyl-phosphate phosphatase Spo0E family protein n=1 Tax=Clostridium sp. HBUAS56017 TaxID=2571128 RepID=UPI00117865E0|nr:aspartyl-phosphate phosphatase Spo0E family protein [Clostridium sp. HBUAS56017]